MKRRTLLGRIGTAGLATTGIATASASATALDGADLDGVDELTLVLADGQESRTVSVDEVSPSDDCCYEPGNCNYCYNECPYKCCYC